MTVVQTLEYLFLHVLRILDESSVEGGNGVVLGRRRVKDEFRSLDLWRAVVCECWGSFTLVVFVCGVQIAWPGWPDPSVSAIAFGAGFGAATVSQCIGHISGAHINPAVTIASVVVRHVTYLRGLLYVIAQCAGAIAGAATLYGITIPKHQNNLGGTFPHEIITSTQAALVEFFVTFAVALTVFATKDHIALQFGSPSLAVGLAYFAGTLLSLPATGASMNPARSLGPAFVKHKWEHHWVYWVGPISGSVLAALLYEHIFCTKKTSKTLKKSAENIDDEEKIQNVYDDPEQNASSKATTLKSGNGGLNLTSSKGNGRVVHPLESFRSTNSNAYSPATQPKHSAFDGSVSRNSSIVVHQNGTPYRYGTAGTLGKTPLDYTIQPGTTKF